MGLLDEAQRLLKNGLDPKSTILQTEKMSLGYTPLHMTLMCYSLDSSFYIAEETVFYRRPELAEIQPEQSLQMIRLLVKAGADVNRQLSVFRNTREKKGWITTPFILALISGFWRAACILLDSGADWEATADEKLPDTDDVCSIDRLLERQPEYEVLVQRVVDFCGHQELQVALDRWRDRSYPSSKECDGSDGSDGQYIGESDGHCEENTEDIKNYLSAQERFVYARRPMKWATTRELLQAEWKMTRTEIKINCNDGQGTNALYCLADGNSDDLRHLLQSGAKLNFVSTSGHGALSKAVRKACLENMSLLLEFGAKIEHQDPRGWTALLYAIAGRSHSMVQRLLDAGAYPHAMLDDGRAGIYLTIENTDPEMFYLLLKLGLNPASFNHYDSAPLHLACFKGLHLKVMKLIEMIPNNINDHSLTLETPLYVAARQSVLSIVRKLLDAGAVIDQTGPENLLESTLMTACAYGQCETVELLLARGASCEVEESRFLSAIGTARAFRQQKIIAILEKYSETVKDAEKA